MQRLRFCISLLFSCLIFIADTHAQNGRFDAKKFKKQQQAFENKAGTRFRQSSPWICEDSSNIDIHKLDEPFVLFLGYYGCAPCRVLMASLNHVLRQHNYKNVTFIYMTMDEVATINEELGSYKNLRRLRCVPVTSDYINQHDLAMNYPTIYFVKRNHIIDYLQTGGASQSGPEVDSWWRQHLDVLQ